MTLQDRLEQVNITRTMLTGILLGGEALHKLARTEPGMDGLPELPKLGENLERLHAQLERLNKLASTLKDQIELEAEPDTEPEPVDPADEFTPARPEITKEQADDLLRWIYFSYPEPPLTGGQIMNRIMEHHAANLPAYTLEIDDDGEEGLEPVTSFAVEDGKIIFY